MRKAIAARDVCTKLVYVSHALSTYILTHVLLADHAEEDVVTVCAVFVKCCPYMSERIFHGFCT
jgi:hypothetical protein